MPWGQGAVARRQTEQRCHLLAVAATATAATAAASTVTAAATAAVVPSLPRPPLRSTARNDDDCDDDDDDDGQRRRRRRRRQSSSQLSYAAVSGPTANSMEVAKREKPLLKDLNEHIMCQLCRGYLIDATTLVECLHSFCRGCIVRLYSGVRACPICGVTMTPPLLSDTRLQRLVYLVVPGLFRSELQRRRHFLVLNPLCPPLPPPIGAINFTLDDFVSLSLEELDETEWQEGENGVLKKRDVVLPACRSWKKKNVNDEMSQGGGKRRYLKCPAAVTVRHLVRLLMLKRGWEETNSSIVNGVSRIEIMYHHYGPASHSEEEIYLLSPFWTLLDLAYIFHWKRVEPMKLVYRLSRKEETLSISEVPSNDAPEDGQPTIENIQRPPTPPPSPKPTREPEVEVKVRQTLENDTKLPRNLKTSIDRDKETKTKKPRCEVTPVMRTPDPPASLPTRNHHHHHHHHHSKESTRSKHMGRMEHRKRRKRRNKRVIAEITTTPREDLLKLKLRLTRPPRITSSGGGSGSSGETGRSKEKLMQLRAVRREKLKALSKQSLAARSSRAISPPSDNSPVHSPVECEEASTKDECTIESEETIEDIIDSIPDEVVRIAQIEDDVIIERVITKRELEMETKETKEVGAKEIKKVKEVKENREKKDKAKEVEQVKEVIENKEVEEVKEAKKVKETRDAWGVKETGETKRVKETGETKRVKETGETKGVKETGETKRVKETGETKGVKETGEMKRVKETGETKGVKETGETKRVKETGETKGVKETEETKRVKETEEMKGVKETGETKRVKETGETKRVKETSETKGVKETREVKGLEETKETASESESPERTKRVMAAPRKDQEILRRLGLVAVNEAIAELRDKAKQRSQHGVDKTSNLDREKLERQLRESKANRVRSLLAEKQMRDALKSMSKTNEECLSVNSTPSSVPATASATAPAITSANLSTTAPATVPATASATAPTTASATAPTTAPATTSATVPTTVATASSAATLATTLTVTSGNTSVSTPAANPAPSLAPTTLKKKGPPPLAPLHVAKSCFGATSSMLLSNTSKYETPLDLSSGGTVKSNVLDLSSSLNTSSNFPTSASSSLSTPSSSLTSSSSLAPSRALPVIISDTIIRKPNNPEYARKGQETNPKTLPEATATALDKRSLEKDQSNAPPLVSTNVANKVALRIPQLHQRISGFRVKLIKPNLSIRQIPNPQAVVASQYRNQRPSYMNTISQQPP